MKDKETQDGGAGREGSEERLEMKKERPEGR